MEATFPAKVIILDCKTFREFDSKIIVYSLGYGRLDLIVRGTKRPKSKLAGHIEPISEADLMVVRGKCYDYAGSARMIDAFSKIKNNYVSLSGSGQIMRMLKFLIKPGETDARIYYLLRDYLNVINIQNISKDKSNLFSLFFILKVISYLGYSPNVNTCLVCEAKNEKLKYYFNYEQGGLVCESCKIKLAKNLPISREIIELMKKILKSDIESFDNLNVNSDILAEFKKILDMYLRYNLNHKL